MSDECSLGVQVAAKMEYHGEKLEDAEELTGEELCRWWSQSFIRPGSILQVRPCEHSTSCNYNFCLCAHVFRKQTAAFMLGHGSILHPWLWNLFPHAVARLADRKHDKD